MEGEHHRKAPDGPAVVLRQCSWARDTGCLPAKVPAEDLGTSVYHVIVSPAQLQKGRECHWGKDALLWH